MICCSARKIPVLFCKYEYIYIYIYNYIYCTYCTMYMYVCHTGQLNLYKVLNVFGLMISKINVKNFLTLFKVNDVALMHK